MTDRIDEPIKRTCPICGAEYETTWGNYQFFCSYECRQIDDKRLKSIYRKEQKAKKELPMAKEPKKRAKLFIDLHRGNFDYAIEDIERRIAYLREQIEKADEHVELYKEWLGFNLAALEIVKTKKAMNND